MCDGADGADHVNPDAGSRRLLLARLDPSGFILGMELMRDGEKRIPFDSALKVGARAETAAMRHGLILRVVGDRLVFAPPLVIEVDEIEGIGERLRRALDDVLTELKSEGALQ
jgi:4-aminobutyrate---pyruvate transaminase